MQRFLTFLILAAILLIYCGRKNTNPIGVEVHRSTVKGRIVDKNGAGLSGALITSDPQGYATTSNSTGNFTLPDLTANTYRFNIHMFDYQDTVSDTITVGIADTQYLAQEIKLKYRYATIRGRIIDRAGAGVTPAGVCVEKQGLSSLTNSKGEFVLSRVEPGTVMLFSAMSGMGYGKKELVAAADDTLSGADIVLENDGGTITGRIVDANNQPVAGAVVSAVGGVLKAVTDANGEFIISEVPSAGEIVLTVASSTDSMSIGVNNLQDGIKLALDTVTLKPAVTANNMTVLSSEVQTITTDSLVTLLANVTASGTTRIASYEWDLDNNGSFETKTAVPWVEVPTGSAGSHSYNVRAVDTAGTYSTTAKIVVRVTAALLDPAVPSGLVCSTPALHSLSLSWTAAERAQGYLVLRRKAGAASFDTVKALSSTAFVDTGLLQGTTYFYRLCAFNTNASVVSTDSVHGTTLALPVPTGVTAVATSSSAVSLVWVMADTSIRQFRIYRSLNDTAYSLAGVAAAASFGDTGLTPATKYFYRLRSIKNGDSSSLSSAAQATTKVFMPAVPVISGVTAGDGSVSVAWDPVPGSTSFILLYAAGTTVDTATATRITGATSPKTVAGLTNGTKYAFAVMAVSATGTSGPSQALTATPAATGAAGTVSDIDGNVYHTVTIGTQVWMVENLRTTRYKDGSAIPLVTGNTEWATLSVSGYCWYGNDTSGKNVYGALYNGHAANSGKLAPNGWHVPSDSEWTVLANFLGGDSVAAGRIKESGTTHWITPNSAATNANGFSALPCGYRDTTGASSCKTYHGFWWTASEYSATDSWYRSAAFNSGEINRSINNKRYGFSIRCVKD
ncbi:MAG: carboxypeptidase regulatory-like domain-containing protein [Chitinispirillaceae bacterium]|jgi:uncharacterized protein (TIGR02145 family)|nr:carboxypeptidase regulatory-like domain-containing protein [Chitinispirillaceae bacterium]